MKRLFVLVLLISTVFAQCIDNGICTDEEKSLNCPDCTFDSVCVDDGKCTNVEFKAGCGDCSQTKVLKCINNGVCSDEEKSIGNCSDCQPKTPSTGLLILAGAIGLIGFFMVVAIIVIVLIAYGMNYFANRRIRM